VRLVLHIPCECGLMGPCFLQCFGKQVLSKSRMRLVNLVLDKRAWVPIGPGSFIAIQGQSVRPVWHEISEDGGQPSCLGSPASREGGGPLKKQKKTILGSGWPRFFLEMTPPLEAGLPAGPPPPPQAAHPAGAAC
jgi:hypothetical protein